jgi:2-(1,2-epoxy-1,2-dihydrophenyl)acetyl-CoA isomerase
VVAALHGAVAGAGVGLALATDLAVAADDLKLNLAYTGIGASPDGGTTFFLARHTGVRRAMELVLENRVLGADEALELGLVNQVVPTAQLEATSLERAQRLARGPTRAFAHSKALLWRSLERSFEAQLEAEGRGIIDMGATRDFDEGVSAFVGKRAPAFRGD